MSSPMTVTMTMVPPFTGRRGRMLWAEADEPDGGPGRRGRRGRGHGLPAGDVPMRHRPHGRRGGRAGRGDVRAALLALLAEQPRHGYEMIVEISERTNGAWRPSAGSVYPALQQLQDEGLVRPEEADGRRVFHLTEAGAAYAEENRDRLTQVWAQTGQDPTHQLRRLVEEVANATRQVARGGTDAQRARARELLAETRRQLYGLLAEGGENGPE